MVDIEKEVKDMLIATLDSLTIKWEEGGGKVQTDIGTSKGAIVWLADFAERVAKEQREADNEFLEEHNICLRQKLITIINK